MVTSSPSLPSPDRPVYRSGAVARMVGMPVTTLRVWERRYGLGDGTSTAAGHRLYSTADVQRLATLRRLTQLGHAIGSLVHLDADGLQAVASTHASARAAQLPPGHRPQAGPRPARPAWVVVGRALARRLQRAAPGLLPALVLRDAPADDPPAHPPADAPALFLASLATLRHEELAQLQRAASAWGAPQLAVVYGYAERSALAAARAAGLWLCRQPQDDEALAACLAQWNAALAEAEPAGLPAAAARAEGPGGPDAPPPRRYDDLTLTDIAALSPTMACECPRHVADLLMQLSHFEAYSGGCAQRDAADAAVHRDLQRTAGLARALFEDALERLAVHEGLVLPRAGAG
ncbi:MerR family transcriptional regulator [Ideonella sp.]|uniref:MerR family transcriptional regulator n=1 Tax=Ideonella sp. TaxID=1929293 RepID=UPI0035B2EEEB